MRMCKKFFLKSAFKNCTHRLKVLMRSFDDGNKTLFTLRTQQHPSLSSYHCCSCTIVFKCSLLFYFALLKKFSFIKKKKKLFSCVNFFFFFHFPGNTVLSVACLCP